MILLLPDGAERLDALCLYNGQKLLVHMALVLLALRLFTSGGIERKELSSPWSTPNRHSQDLKSTCNLRQPHPLTDGMRLFVCCGAAFDRREQKCKKVELNSGARGVNTLHRTLG